MPCQRMSWPCASLMQLDVEFCHDVKAQSIKVFGCAFKVYFGTSSFDISSLGTTLTVSSSILYHTSTKSCYVCPVTSKFISAFGRFSSVKILMVTGSPLAHF
ncbi:hypothetical protein TNCV_1751571 [Trichonephila clavipes]|nr:hypothetical protein TNCV_1751571 [Trichonephila clavipes]